jgi:hypothetical protein
MDEDEPSKEEDDRAQLHQDFRHVLSFVATLVASRRRRGV